MKKILATLMVFVLAICITGCSGKMTEEKSLIVSHSNSDGRYTVCLYQVGDPAWSFGSVAAELVLKNAENEEINKVSFSLRNDGAPVFEDNIKEIAWSENQVEVLMCEFDTTQEFTYVLNYSK